MSRPRKTDRPTTIRFSIPRSMLMELETRLYDPATAGTKFGAKGELICRLLREWLTEQQELEDERNNHQPSAKTTADRSVQHEHGSKDQQAG